MARGKAKAAADGPVEGPWTLPEGWRWERLGNYVSDGGASVTPSRLPGSDFQLFSVPSFPTGRPEILKGSAIGSSKQSVQSDDILLCKINPRINRVWRVRDLENGIMIASTEWIRFAANKEVEPDFLRYYLTRDEVRNFLAMNVSGVGGSLMRVRPSTVDPIAFPLPPIKTQQHIVARIDALFAEIDDGEAALARARTDLATWRKALLKAAVTGELTADWRAANPPTETGAALLARILADRRARWLADPRNKGKSYVEPAGPDSGSLPELPVGWSWATAEMLTSGARGAIVIGPFGSDLKTTDYEQTGVPLIFVRHIRAGNFTGLRPNFISIQKAGQLANHLALPGDVLITKMGDPPGDASVYPSKLPPAVITADCIRWRPSNHLSSTFLSEWVNSQPGRSWITSKTKGVAQQKITLELFRAMPIPVPPADEAVAIERELKQARQAVEHLAKTEDDCSVAATTLRQSILAAAFRGDLLA